MKFKYLFSSILLCLSAVHTLALCSVPSDVWNTMQRAYEFRKNRNDTIRSNINQKTQKFIGSIVGRYCELFNNFVTSDFSKTFTDQQTFKNVSLGCILLFTHLPIAAYLVKQTFKSKPYANCTS